jgi:hypothetical protein
MGQSTLTQRRTRGMLFFFGAVMGLLVLGAANAIPFSISIPTGVSLGRSGMLLAGSVVFLALVVFGVAVIYFILD